MPRIAIEDDSLCIGPRLRISFQRTLRIPDDGRRFPLPPGLGRLPVLRVADHAARCPAEWKRRNGVFVPLRAAEALWLAFDGVAWRPDAVQVGVGTVNAVSGEPWAPGALRADPQDYLVCPDQPWLDGINAGDGFIRQFVATELGAGATVEGQVLGVESAGGIQIAVRAAKSGRFPSRAPRRRYSPSDGEGLERMQVAPEPTLGLAAGGMITQKIYPDVYGIETWERRRRTTIWVYLAGPQLYQRVTGRPPPPTPISAEAYVKAGLPWFELYDDDRGDVPAPARLAAVKGVDEFHRRRRGGGGGAARRKGRK